MKVKDDIWDKDDGKRGRRPKIVTYECTECGAPSGEELMCNQCLLNRLEHF